MIELTMLPAKDGDSLLLIYGDATRIRRVLIDGGRASSYPLIRRTLVETGSQPLDLLVVTHVDQDHVLGVLAMFKDPKRMQFNDVWFNGYEHLNQVDLEAFGPVDGELLTTALLAQKVPWNKAFLGRAIMVEQKFNSFDDEATFRILSPDETLLKRLIPFWRKECETHGLIPGKDAVVSLDGFESLGAGIDIEALAATKFEADRSTTNATSIGFLFEYDGIRLIFTGDGDDARLVTSLRSLAGAEGGRVRIDALKVAHHGSAGNISKELLDLIDCPLYLISTNGARHGHPDDVAMARILKYGGDHKEIVFNYRERAAIWDVAEWKDTYGYTVRAPVVEDGVLKIQW